MNRNRRFRPAFAWWVAIALAAPPVRTSAQQRPLPFAENFDAAAVPSLPAGWSSSRNRTPGMDDFTLSTTAPRSSPHCAATTNATVPQSLSSPVFDLAGVTAARLGWSTRRSATFNAAIVCEASIDSGVTFPFLTGDTLRPSGATSYVASLVTLPPVLAGERRVCFRWRVIPDVSGTSGTLRFDDVTLGDVAAGDSAGNGAVIVNEVMYAPAAGEPEWIELLNMNAQPVNLRDWTVADAASSRRTIAASDFRIGPGEFVVLTGDSAALRAFDPGIPGRIQEVPGFPALNDAGDAVTLSDVRGVTIDSVAYSPSWHSPAVQNPRGRSLERILARGVSADGGNWTTCALPRGGTPAGPNSAARRPGTAGAALSCFPNPFSPDNDGVDDATVIHYALPPGIWTVHLRVYDVRGRLIRRLATSVPGAGQGDVVWDGRDDERVRGRLGAYVVALVAFEQKRGLNVSGKTVVVLAGRL